MEKLCFCTAAVGLIVKFILMGIVAPFRLVILCLTVGIYAGSTFP